MSGPELGELLSVERPLPSTPLVIIRILQGGVIFKKHKHQDNDSAGSALAQNLASDPGLLF